MAGIAAEQGGLGSKVVVLKALGGDPEGAVLRDADPGLPAPGDGVDATACCTSRRRANCPQGVQARVWLNEDEAFVPDLEAIETLIGDAMAQAA